MANNENRCGIGIGHRLCEIQLCRTEIESHCDARHEELVDGDLCFTLFCARIFEKDSMPNLNALPGLPKRRNCVNRSIMTGESNTHGRAWNVMEHEKPIFFSCERTSLTNDDNNGSYPVLPVKLLL